MPQKFSDAARATLQGSISATATSLLVSSGGEKFPFANTGSATPGPLTDWFKAVLQDATHFEIILVRSHGTGTETNLQLFTDILRGQDGTTARSFASGTVMGLRQTAADATMAASKQNALTISETPPANAKPGDEWTDPSTGAKYTYFFNAEFQEFDWIEFGSQNVVIEGSFAALPTTGGHNVIYVTTDTGSAWFWSGSSYQSVAREAVVSKVVTGTTGAAGVSVSVPHGLDASKIVSMTGLAGAAGDKFSPGSPIAAQQFSLSHTTTHAVVTSGPSATTTITGQPFTVMIWHNR